MPEGRRPTILTPSPNRIASAFHQEKGFAFLDSSRNDGDQGRYSILAWNSRAVVRMKDENPFPAIDRLRLASLILDELAVSGGAGLDLREDWSDEDLADLSRFSLKHAVQSVPAEGATKPAEGHS